MAMMLSNSPALAADLESFPTSSLKMDEFIIQRPGIEYVSRADSEAKHEVIIAVKQQNIDILEQKLLERSTPGDKYNAV